MVAGFTYALTGRRLDLEFLQTPRADAERTQLTQTLVSPVARAVTGVHSATQRLMLLLLTRLSDVAWAPTMGTRFVDSITYTGRTLGQVERAAAFALSSALTQLRAANAADTTPPTADEDIVGARVTGVSTPEPGRVRVSIELTTAAGDALVVVLPVPLT